MTTDGKNFSAESVDAGTVRSSNGHLQLKWGTIIFLVGSALIFSMGVMGDSSFVAILGLLGILAALSGFIVWAIGMILRFKFNKRSDRSMPFTPGEKVSLVGAVLFLFGILLVNGEASGDGLTFARLVGVVGLIGAAGGAFWHLLTPRPVHSKTSRSPQE